MSKKRHEITCGFDGGDTWPYIAVDGVRVAEKRVPGESRIGWIAVEPGWTVIDGDGVWPREIIGPDGPITVQ